MKRSYEQLKLYHAYIRQLRQAKEIKVQVEDKDFIVRFGAIKNPRYLLKALDIELPRRNEHFPHCSSNKNEFCDAYMEDLTHHISWIREVLWDNGIVPFNDKGLL